MSEVETAQGTAGAAQDGIASLGKRVRQRREEMKLSLAELAKMTGLTPSFLSQVETGKTGLSINSLRLLSDVLAVPIFHFLLEEDDAIGGVVRQDQRKTIRFPNSDMRYELLVPNLNYSLEVWMGHMEPGMHSSDEPRTHPADECMVILQGTMELHLGQETHTLVAGDSITYDGRIPHKAINVSDEELIFISAMSPPVF